MKEAPDGLELLREAFAAESRISREWREKHDKDAAEFREKILSDIQPFKEFATSLNWSWKIALGISGIVWSVIKGLAWLKEHLK